MNEFHRTAEQLRHLTLAQLFEPLWLLIKLCFWILSQVGHLISISWRYVVLFLVLYYTAVIYWKIHIHLLMPVFRVIGRGLSFFLSPLAVRFWTYAERIPRLSRLTSWRKKKREKAAREKEEQAKSPHYKPPPRPPTAWEILGLEKGATRDEIKAAYRSKMLTNHPDKVAGLDPAFQRLANERAVEIQRAYSTLVGD